MSTTGEATARRAAGAGTQASAAQGGLRIQSINKILGGRVIIDDLSLDVQEGELVSLLGPSGCGKTTTLRMIAGFLTPDSGTISVAGKDVTKLGADRRPSAMVFQNYALWPHMTVFKNIAFPLKLRKLPKHEIEERVSRVLDLVNLSHHRDSRPGQISGGEQQRVALARAIVQEPDLLLLDEPLSNLDAKLRVQVREDIHEIQKRLGITTVIVTHDQDEALSISDRIAVMNQGKIEQFSTPAELYDKPQTMFVATFIGSLNQISGSLGNGLITPSTDVVGVRPEDVAYGSEPFDGGVPATVRRVIPRGHFHEVALERDDATLNAYISGTAPQVGDRGYAKITRAFTFRDGALVTEH